MPHLAGLTHLEWMHLGSTEVTDDGLPNLHGLKKLAALEITFCPGITAEGLKRLQEAVPALKDVKY